MKKILLAISLLSGLMLTAQEEVKEREIFNIAVRGGLNFSNFSSMEADTKTGFYVGLSIPLEFSKFYTLNPEINYSAQGAKNVNFRSYNYTTGSNEIIKQDIDANYISVNIINRFTAKKAFIEFGPGLDFISKSEKYHVNGVDLTFNIGLGYTVTDKIAIQGRFKKGIVAVVESYQNQNYNYYGENGYNQVFSLGIQYKL